MKIKKRGRPKKIIKIQEQNEFNISSFIVSQEAIKPTFSAILVLGDEREKEELKGEGETILDAFNSIPIVWEKIKTKGTIIVSDGAKTAEKFFYLKPLKRIFANKIIKVMWARNFEKLLNAN